tara:strand:+ start:31094 stop:31546 length:453 start_codon:yes stop_codon:yes gene_type:complete
VGGKHVLRRKAYYNVMMVLAVWANAVMAIENGDPETDNLALMRDPFTPSQLMYQIRGTELSSYSRAGTFNPNDAVATDIPDMRLRGFVSDDSEKMLALLEVVGRGVYMVREGDEININPRRPSEAIRITSITRLGVTVETGTIGKIRVLK